MKKCGTKTSIGGQRKFPKSRTPLPYPEFIRDMSKEETMRRLRLGDLQRFFRKRWGHSLPDDDAGREDLRELLLLASLAYNPDRTMRNMMQNG